MATPKMKKDRLLLLAKELLKLNKKAPKGWKFDLTWWAERKEERHGKIPTKLTCATSACAVGTAMLLPQFRKLGLKAEMDPGYYGLMRPVFRGEKDFKAVEKFFGIERAQALYLFDPSEYHAKDQGEKRGLTVVAARIEYFVKTDGAYLNNPTDDN